VRVLSLHGMGGIGKTTLAHALFSRLSSGSLRFSSQIFLEVGHEALLQDKQRQLLSMLAGSGMPTAGSATQLQQQVRDCTGRAGPLLLVLDDIWTAAQREALLCIGVLPDGSRVILTGRNSGNLHPDNDTLGCVARPVELLAPAEAERLLCQHAFAADRAPPGHGTAVQQALAACGGLPLALQVVGAGMRSREPEEAEVKRLRQQKLQVAPSGKWFAANACVD
jgi:NB-ARC domain